MLLRVVLATLSLVTIVLWFALLRPAALGVPVQYVIIEGTSMEPTLSTGDLVLVRKQDDYVVGDVISFRTPIGPVIHRIIDGNARDGFVPMGDNNGAADPWPPTPADIVGRAWVTLPGGERLRWLAPISLSVSGALFAGLDVHVLLRTRAPTRSERRSARRREPRHDPVRLYRCTASREDRR